MKKIFIITLFSLSILTSFASQTELLIEPSHLQPEKSFWVAVKLHLDPKAHTYWQNPGDTGLPTSIEWNLPDGFSASDIFWQTPNRYRAIDIITYGYENEAYFLTLITPPTNLPVNQSFTIEGSINWLECDESCTPKTATFSTSIQSSDTPPSLNPIFESLRNNLAQKLNANWSISAHIKDSSFGLLIKPIGFQPEPKNVYFYFDNPDVQATWLQKLEVVEEGFFLNIPINTDTIPEQISGILTTESSWSANSNIKGLLVNTTLTPYPLNSKETTSLSLAILFALIGGLALNLMPCVFPVLSLKILGFVQHANNDPRKIKLHGLAFTAGVLLSFWILSGILLALRAGGELLGWGFQLQSPLFIVFLILLLVSVALNFLGVFEVGTSLIAVGGKLDKGHSGYLGSFSSGILATVLATPCTAPFMGTALGFALTIPAIQSLLIFTSLAIGMALPYLLLSYAPKLMRYLPRPGAWMETFKQAMAFPLFATVIWLLWVFSLQTNNTALLYLLFGILFISIAAWIYGKFCTFSTKNLPKFIALFTTLLFIIAASYISFQASSFTTDSSTTTTIASDNDPWEPFSQELLEKHLAEGRPVYVDFTAAWCLTCQTNKATVFNDASVLESFKNKNVALLKADWTRRDPKITEALLKHGRSGVPTNIIYSAKENQSPIILPSVLTSKVIIDNLSSL